MRGKAGLVIGLGVGYVLGTRAGRARYEQIKSAAQSVWNLAPVQTQVDKVKVFARSSALAVPGAVWEGAVKVAKAAGRKGSPGEKLDAALAQGKRASANVKKAAEDTIEDAARAVDDKD